jgi:3-keto-5-aminohexanoate cleavage enzyme
MARPSSIYVRDKQGRLTPDTTDFQATIDPVIRHSNLIIQASTGGVSSLSIAERCAPGLLSVEMASLNVGSVNLGDAVYFNPGPDVEYCSKQISTLNIIPEFEVFEIGMINNILALQEKINSKHRCCLILYWGIAVVPATVDALIAMRSMPREAYGE